MKPRDFHGKTQNDHRVRKRAARRANVAAAPLRRVVVPLRYGNGLFAPGEESRPRNVSPDAREEEGPWEGIERRGEGRTERLLTLSLKMKYEQGMAITFVGQFCLCYSSHAKSVVFYVSPTVISWRHAEFARVQTIARFSGCCCTLFDKYSYRGMFFL